MPYLMLAPSSKPTKFAESVSHTYKESRSQYSFYPATIRELRAGVQSKMVKMAKFLYDSNPLARRIVELTKNFVLGEGLYYTAKSPQVKEVLDKFWYDDVNNWPVRQHERLTELCLYGEWVWPVSINPINGHVTLGYIDPLDITKIELDKDNPLLVSEVKVSGRALERNSFKVIRKVTDPQSPKFGRYDGEVFFFAINKVSNQPRGTSDLLPLIDWISSYDDFLFNRLERNALINNFIWDVILEGADEKEIEDFRARLQSPTPGTVRVHNEKVKWDVISPNLSSSDAEKEANLIRGHILSGAGYPPHFFSDFSGVRATAYEAYFPTEKSLVTRQKIVKSFLEIVFKFVIDQAIIAKKLLPDVDTSFEIIFPEISIRDLERASRALVNVTSALDKAIERGWVSKTDCQKIIASILNQIGLTLELEEIR